MPYFEEITIAILGYLLGCFTTGYYIVRFFTRKDARDLGSGSVGARNISRILGRGGFAVTFIGDFTKGAIAVGLARLFDLDPWGVMLVILAVVAGHIWPIQLSFRGGKGIATTLGAMLVFNYQLALVLLALAGILLVFTKRLTPSGLVAVILSPVIAFIMGHSAVTIVGIALLVILILTAHRANISAILRGTRDHGEVQNTRFTGLG